MSNDETQVTIGDEVVSLADLAGLDISEVQMNRGPVATPVGVFEFIVKEAVIGHKAVKKDGVEINKPTVEFKLEIADVITMVDAELEPDDFIGETHFETFWISDLKKDVGRVKALMVDAGFEGAGPFQELLDAFVGHNFIGAIKQRKDRNDPDRIYANLDSKKITPVNGAEEAAA